MSTMQESPIPKKYAWADFKSYMRQVIDHLSKARYPKDNHPGYHIIVTIWEKEITKGQGEQKFVVDYKPAIDSSICDEMGGWFDCHFITEQRTRVEPDPQTAKPKFVQEFVIHTINWDGKHKTKDGIAGQGDNNLHRLPDEIPNDFPTLQRLWRGEKT